MTTTKKIGILGIQGDVEEHIDSILKLGYEAIRVRTISELEGIDALIIPGGESTTMGKIMDKYGFIDKIRELNLKKNIPILGTCAGMVLLSKETGIDQPLLKLMDVSIDRNAYGGQVESFEKEIELDGNVVHAVFIRAPLVKELMSDEISVISKNENRIVGIIQNNCMAISFHPELSENGIIVYKYFFDKFLK
ncbi:pyridoxal 5'-phosphate synthase glutaminase subunit PdxT [Methanococcus voltae]|uniref:Pyridoxal 5'-phosphate synthase subunit PdxT n=2 Tax=Methanococcus voltae TaxID=2188 RepID=A0A8J7USH8_METVO|nr:pyridoxal 5'-phosphate synthase glutaminase subunit PdxT [Methanococcus voltae]MBP2172380.1 5'-phosphate synthase pdxT subunit [Methanococcus voltae]MBP2200664.1 5'-phosphate synthase pdxT subunit [Methanococcus voltae]MCS3921389.1 5'-phosphate synthase pdxT subunit [Methanococcus voltae PS]